MRSGTILDSDDGTSLGEAKNSSIYNADSRFGLSLYFVIVIASLT